MVYCVECFLEISENSTGKMTFVHIRLYIIIIIIIIIMFISYIAQSSMR